MLKQNTSGRRSGFSLVELLVVIVIIGVLLGLLLPAVQKARESASRMSCTNRMRQIGLAFHNYADVHKSFPPGWVGYDTNEAGEWTHPCVNGTPGWGWATFILPFMERGTVLESFNTSVPIGVKVNGVRTNEEEMKQLLMDFRCPSESKFVKTFTLEELQKQEGCLLNCTRDHEGEEEEEHDGHEHHTDHELELAACNYVGNFGTENLHDAEKFGHGGLYEGYNFTGDGAFWHNSGLSFEAVEKGLTHLILTGERALGKKHYSTWVGVPQGTSPALVVASSNHSFDNTGTEHGFSSCHPTGANFLRGDGGVEFISETVDAHVFQEQTCRKMEEH